jgi:hypothetical protein
MGKKAYLHRSATIIQSHWRGIVAGRKYWDWLMEQTSCSTLNHRWLEKKLSMQVCIADASFADCSPISTLVC